MLCSSFWGLTSFYYIFSRNSFLLIFAWLVSIKRSTDDLLLKDYTSQPLGALIVGSLEFLQAMSIDESGSKRMFPKPAPLSCYICSKCFCLGTSATSPLSTLAYGCSCPIPYFGFMSALTRILGPTQPHTIVLVYPRVSWQQDCWHFQPIILWGRGSVLGLVGCSTPSLASIS